MRLLSFLNTRRAAPQLQNDADRELLRRLDHAVDCMRRIDRWVFLCHRVDDLSYQEIAARGRISVEQVEQSMMRALAVLSDKMDAHYVPPRRKIWQFWQRHR